MFGFSVPNKVCSDCVLISQSTAKQTSEERSVKNSQSWSRTTAFNSNQKPAAASSSLRDRNPTATSSLSMASTLSSKASAQMLPEGSRNSQFTSSSSFQDGMSSEGMSQEEPAQAPELPAEPVENVEPSPFTLRTANSRKYQRPGRDAAAASSDSADGGVAAPETPCADAKPNTTVGTGVGKTAANANTAAAKAPAAGRGRGRVRDYTVLHPSCLSVCNVTIQDTIERSIDELVAPAAPADLGEAGLMKKKSDVQLTKTR